MKNVLVHGSEESLNKFFSEKLSKKKYNCLAILTDEEKVKNSSVEIIKPDNLPKFVYSLIDAVVLTDKSTRQRDIDYFKNFVEPKKIICWNPDGYLEHFAEKISDGTEIFYMEGLEFHIKNSDDDRFFRNTRYSLYLNNQFYALDEKDYPAKMAELYQNAVGKPLDWNNLKTWSEKMQWLKLYDSTPIKTRLADKFLVRSWIAEKIGDEYLIPLIGVWDNFDEIDFDAMPNQFVLKCNHGWNMNIICRDKKTFDVEDAREKINAWLSIDFGMVQFEPHYSNIKRKIIAEKFMTDGKNFDLTDYKFWCFNGEPKYCCFYTNRSVDCRLDYFDMNWNLTNFESSEHHNSDHPEKIQKPKNFELMKNLAAKLCKEFIFVRVDFYEIEGKVYIGEITFTPGTGNLDFKPDGANEYLGSLMTLTQGN